VRPKTPQHTGFPDSPALESAGVMRPEAPLIAEVQDRPEADPGVGTSTFRGTR